MSLSDAVHNHSDQDRKILARLVIRLFEHWRLDTEDQLSMLGLSTSNRAALSKYRKGEPLASSRDLLDRVGHLLYIHKSLRLIFPQDIDLAYLWMKQRNSKFEGRTPVEMVRECGFAGVLMVRSYLERTRNI